MSTDTFSSTDPITKNTKKENYKVHNKIRLSLLQLLLLLHPLAPPCRVINSSQTSLCKAEPPHGFLLCVVEGKEKGHLLPVVVVFDHLQAGCLMLLLQPVLRDVKRVDHLQAGCLMLLFQLVLHPSSLSTKGSSFPGRSYDPLSQQRVWWILHSFYKSSYLRFEFFISMQN